MGKWKKSSDELKAQFKNVMEKFESAEHRKMFGYPCCFLNNHMFTGLHEENWVLRLSPRDRANLMANEDAEPFAPMGRLMKEYVILPQSVLACEDTLKKWVAASLEFVNALPPKQKKT